MFQHQVKLNLSSILKLSLVILLLVAFVSCGPLLERPPDNTPPTDIELFGEKNSITINMNGQSLVFQTNGVISHKSFKATKEIPAHSILEFGGRAGESGIAIKVYQDGELVTNGGYDGASSLFSLDGSVILDLTLEGERYYSLEYGPGAGGTKIYYNSFVSLTKLRLQSYNQPQGIKAVKEIKGTFKGFLKPYGEPPNSTQIIINGKINFIATE